MHAMPRFQSFALALALLLIPVTSIAGESATGHLSRRLVALNGVVDETKSAAREHKLHGLMDEVFDYEELAKRSLGAKEWEARTPAERKKFQSLLEQLVRRSYQKSLDKVAGYKVDFKSEKADGGDVRVATRAHKTGASPVKIDYVLHDVKGTWRVFDVFIEDSSLVANYRSQFSKVIQKKGFDALLEKLQKKVDSGN